MTISSEQSHIAKLLLDRIPEAARTAVVQEAVQSLRHDSKPSEVSLAVALLEERPNDQAREAVLSHLYASLLNGDLQQAELVCSLDQEFRQDALDRVVVRLNAVSTLHLQAQTELQAVRMGTLFPVMKDVEILDDSISNTAIVTLLRFASSAGSSELGVRSLIR